MIVEIIPDIGTGPPVRLPCSQVVIRREDGTPVVVAAKFGPERAIAASIAGDADFNRMLHALGINMTVITDRLELPKPPPGAKLIAGPDVNHEGD